MEQRAIGATGPAVGVFGLGTMTFGAEADEEASHAMLDRFAEAGGTLIDTADVYSAGESERIVGNWLRGHDRSAFVVATKGRFPMGDDPAERGAGRAYLTRALDASLGRLGLDHIDLYQVHAWDPDTPLVETLETLDDFVTQGKVGHIGVSNYTAWQLARAALTARHGGSAPITGFQAQYSLLGREIELELLPLCLEEEIGVLVWSPLAGGWLTGKYQRDQRPTGDSRLGDDPTRGIEAYDLRNHSRTWDVIDAVGEIGAAHGATPAQVALNWVRGRPGVACVLLGARTVEQLEDNLGALGWDLSVDETARLDEVSAPGIPIYPYGFLETYAGVDVWARLGTRAEPPPIGR